MKFFAVDISYILRKFWKCLQTTLLFFYFS